MDLLRTYIVLFAILQVVLILRLLTNAPVHLDLLTQAIMTARLLRPGIVLAMQSLPLQIVGPLETPHHATLIHLSGTNQEETTPHDIHLWLSDLFTSFVLVTPYFFITQL